jgi:putative transposase
MHHAASSKGHALQNCFLRREALEEALAWFGRPEIFNTDQGSQFTSPWFTGVLRNTGVRISMDGRGQ